MLLVELKPGNRTVTFKNFDVNFYLTVILFCFAGNVPGLAVVQG